MQRENTAMVVAAGGYGHFAEMSDGKLIKKSKVVADLHGKPMVRRVLETLLNTHLFNHYYVVVNDTFGGQVQEALHGIEDITYVYQPHRVGTAGAMALALAKIPRTIRHIGSVFTDMPLWRGSTFQLLAERHMAVQPEVTMVTIPLQPGHPAERYGRILKDEHGKIEQTFEPWEIEAMGEEQKNKLLKRLRDVKEVNPSLYMFNRSFLQETLPHLPLIDKGDGFHLERRLQDTLKCAKRIEEVRIQELEQALGVNDEEELREVREVAWHMFQNQPEALVA